MTKWFAVSGGAGTVVDAGLRRLTEREHGASGSGDEALSNDTNRPRALGVTPGATVLERPRSSF